VYFRVSIKHTLQHNMVHLSFDVCQMHIAACNGYVRMLDLLLHHGASVSCVDNDGWQPLHCAICWGQVCFLFTVPSARDRYVFSSLCHLLGTGTFSLHCAICWGQVCFLFTVPSAGDRYVFSSLCHLLGTGMFTLHCAIC